MITADNLCFVATLLTALGCGVSAGLLFIFSNTVMKALARINPTEGIAAMQAINDVILNPTFFIVFLGTAGASVLWLVAWLLGWHENMSLFLILGSMIYLLGCMLVTLVFNIPMNNKLAVADSSEASSTELWDGYLVKWTRWNHVRTVAAIAATVSFMLALRG